MSHAIVVDTRHWRNDWRPRIVVGSFNVRPIDPLWAAHNPEAMAEGAQSLISCVGVDELIVRESFADIANLLDARRL